MKHARSDYQERIVDLAGKIPDDEPVLLLRAQDACSRNAVRAYIEALEADGADPRMVASMREQERRMGAWRVQHGLMGRRPDVPADVRVITDPVEV